MIAPVESCVNDAAGFRAAYGPSMSRQAGHVGKMGLVSTADLHAAAFFKEAVERDAVWLLRIDDDEGPGYAQAGTKAGEVAVGLWSTKNRAAKIASTVPAYKGYRPERLTLDELLTTWVPNLDAASSNVGLNWSGPRAQGARVTTYALVYGLRKRVWDLGAPEREARRAAEWGG